MKPSLQLKFSQQLTMTPQLQQAIKLLQLSTLDLQLEIQEALDSNPLLEIDESELHNDSSDSDSEPQDYTDKNSLSAENSDNVDSHDALENNQIPDDLPLDSSWEEYLSASSAPANISNGPADDDYIFQGETTENIQDHLIWQMELTPFSDIDRSIAIAIIDSIDESGYLTVSSEEILDSLQNEEIELDEVECVLKLD